MMHYRRPLVRPPLLMRQPLPTRILVPTPLLTPMWMGTVLLTAVLKISKTMHQTGKMIQ